MTRKAVVTQAQIERGLRAAKAAMPEQVWTIDRLPNGEVTLTPTVWVAAPKPPEPERMPTLTQLYRHFDADGNLLYVGISVSAVVRMEQHRSSAHWYASIAKVTIENFPTRDEALAAEITAIRTENPKFNIFGRAEAA